jgi:hypothetical protein
MNDQPFRVPGDIEIGGTVRAKLNRPSNGSVTASSLAGDAELPAGNLVSRTPKTSSQNGTAVAETIVVHDAFHDGQIQKFAVGSIGVAIGAATATIDLKKSTGGGAPVSILSAPIVLDSANASLVDESTTVTDTSYLAGDKLIRTISVAAGGGTLPTGVYSSLVTDEDPA